MEEEEEFESEFDYQGDHAAVFAQALCLALRQRYPGVKTRYLLLLAEPADKPGPLNRQLIHAYVAFAQYLLDSDGISELQDTKDRLAFWEEIEEEAIALDPKRRGQKFNTEIRLEEDLFPELIKFRCPDAELKQDVAEFLSRSDIRRILPRMPVKPVRPEPTADRNQPIVTPDKKID